MKVGEEFNRGYPRLMLKKHRTCGTEASSSDHTLLVQRRYSTCIGLNYNSKDAVPTFHESLSYY